MPENDAPQQLIGMDAGSPPAPKPEECDPPRPTPCKAPTEDDIRLLAYFLWTERVGMGMESDEKADWRQSEKFLWEEYNACCASQGIDQLLS